MRGKSNGLKQRFRKITVYPLILFGILSLFVSSYIIYSSMRDETEEELNNLAHSMKIICELSGNGDYHEVNGVLYKGDQPFDIKNKIVDNLKKKSNIDTTIFLGDKRISTSVLDEHGKRAIDTVASYEVSKTVLKEGKEYFSDKVEVNTVPYFGHYVPLKNKDGSTVGMIFVGKSRKSVMQTIGKAILANSIILIIIVLFVMIITFTYSGGIILSLTKIKEFLGLITKGNVDSNLDPAIINRKDEIGEMARFSIMLQKSVSELIMTDALTGLYNRRSSTLFLQNAIRDFDEKNIPFTVVIGDIDDFKKINDTYGHMIGDEVLKSIAAIFLRFCGHNDIIARWGGEEFLFIYKQANKEEALSRLKVIQDHIHHMRCSTNNYDIHVTMTFGICEYTKNTDMEQILKDADDKLYFGKNGGKDQVVQ